MTEGPSPNQSKMDILKNVIPDLLREMGQPVVKQA